MDNALRAAGAVYAGVREAYGWQEPLSDAQSRVAHPEEWCSCTHHTTEHHGPKGDGPCSATGCACVRFDR